MMPFTSHNIRLADGSYTVSSDKSVLADAEWLRAAIRTLKLIFPNGLEGKTIVDLGCLEGGYTLEFARLGMHATGIEVRQSNYENCEIVKSWSGVSNLRFVKDDVWNLAAYGQFDVCFCCGLLYHLDRPRDFMELMNRSARSAVIINTHFAPHGESEVFKLSSPTTNEGVPGRWYHEHDSNNLEDIETYTLSSWNNKTSFWLTREAILHLLRGSGFTVVFEQLDFLGAEILPIMSHGYYNKHHRGMFVGVRV
jgi:SAM-dependent methyltransferase